MDIILALQRAVRGYKHGTEALAAATGMSATTLNHKVSPTYLTQWPSPEEMAQIMEVTEDHSALMAMNERLGYVALALPKVTGSEEDERCLGALLNTVREFAEFTAAFSQAAEPQPIRSGGKGDAATVVVITDNERARIEKEGAEAIAAIQKVIAWSAQKNEEQKPAHLRLA